MALHLNTYLHTQCEYSIHLKFNKIKIIEPAIDEVIKKAIEVEKEPFGHEKTKKKSHRKPHRSTFAIAKHERIRKKQQPKREKEKRFRQELDGTFQIIFTHLRGKTLDSIAQGGAGHRTIARSQIIHQGLAVVLAHLAQQPAHGLMDKVVWMPH